MAASLTNELQEFHRFVAEKLANGGTGLSPEAVVDEWRILHPNSEDLSAGAALLRQALAEADRGEFVSAGELIAETRKQLDLPIVEAARIRDAILEGYQDAIHGRTTVYRGDLRQLRKKTAD
jgi:hypothetical protein